MGRVFFCSLGKNWLYSEEKRDRIEKGGQINDIQKSIQHRLFCFAFIFYCRIFLASSRSDIYCNYHLNRTIWIISICGFQKTKRSIKDLLLCMA